jgi:hypothetical protein
MRDNRRDAITPREPPKRATLAPERSTSLPSMCPLHAMQRVQVLHAREFRGRSLSFGTGEATPSL